MATGLWIILRPVPPPEWLRVQAVEALGLQILHVLSSKDFYDAELDFAGGSSLKSMLAMASSDLPVNTLDRAVKKEKKIEKV